MTEIKLEIVLEEFNPEFYSIVNGKKFDVEKESGSIWSDHHFRSYREEFRYIYQVEAFIDYMVSAPVLEYAWNMSCGGYETLEYKTKTGKEKLVFGNYGLTQILRNMARGVWDTSEVLADFCVEIRRYIKDGCVIEGNKDKYNKILNDLKKGSEFKFELIPEDYQELRSKLCQ